MNMLEGLEKPNPDGPILMPELFPPKYFLELPEYKPQPEDVVLSAYPRAGQLWMQDMLYQVMHRGQYVQDVQEFDENHPWLERHTASEIATHPSPRVIKTHFSPGVKYMTFDYDPSCTYIYVVRNPLDTVVSSYYHWKDWRYTELDFNQHFEWFLAGDMLCGDFLSHIKRWLPFLDRDNLLLVKYEDMKKDTVHELRRIADFLVHRSIIQKWYNEKNLEEIVSRSSFQNMSDRSLQKSYLGKAHMRKGVVGDWKKHLSADKKERLVSKFLDGVKGTVAENWWPELL